MPATTCAGTRRDGKDCTRPPGWGLPDNHPDADSYCKVHTREVWRKAETLKKRFLEILEAEDVTISEAARELETSVTSLFFLRRNDPDFDAAVRDLYQANGIVRVEAVESAMYKRLIAADSNAPAALYVFYLCNRAPDDWKSVQHIRLAGPEGGPLEFELSNARQLLEDRINRVATRVGASLPTQVPNGSGSP